ncbi:MAG TPA: hypothetical protein VJG32_15460 [Anaerolineae bacterium]|nr:hypothetical protein [Anaerolineae bacterium]
MNNIAVFYRRPLHACDDLDEIDPARYVRVVEIDPDVVWATLDPLEQDEIGPFEVTGFLADPRWPLIGDAVLIEHQGFVYEGEATWRYLHTHEYNSLLMRWQIEQATTVLGGLLVLFDEQLDAGALPADDDRMRHARMVMASLARARCLLFDNHEASGECGHCRWTRGARALLTRSE